MEQQIEQLRILILELEEKVADIKIEKARIVRTSKYEEAAKIRDKEKLLLEELEAANKKLETLTNE